jgi:tetratricopeptide (TPR) repeat protein
MVKAGALLPEDENLGFRAFAARVRPAAIVATLGAIAAVLVLAVALARLRPPEPSGVLARLERLERQCAAGDFDEALAGAEQLLRGPAELDAAARRRAERLAETAAYRLARARLRAGDFRAVLELEEGVSPRTASSPRLENLKLRAEQGETTELALAGSGSLTDYGFHLDGRTYAMDLPDFDREKERILDHFARAVSDHPADLALRLNYGHFLLSLNRWDEAGAQFAAARKIDEAGALARLGLGLAAFRSQRFDDALEHFEAAARLDPRNLAARVNAAICLERLGRHDDARQRWQRLLESVDDAGLRKKIESHLARS